MFKTLSIKGAGLAVAAALASVIAASPAGALTLVPARPLPYCPSGPQISWSGYLVGTPAQTITGTCFVPGDPVLVTFTTASPNWTQGLWVTASASGAISLTEEHPPPGPLLDTETIQASQYGAASNVITDLAPATPPTFALGGPRSFYFLYGVGYQPGDEVFVEFWTNSPDAWGLNEYVKANAQGIIYLQQPLYPPPTATPSLLTEYARAIDQGDAANPSGGDWSDTVSFPVLIP